MPLNVSYRWTGLGRVEAHPQYVIVITRRYGVADAAHGSNEPGVMRAVNLAAEVANVNI